MTGRAASLCLALALGLAARVPLAPTPARAQDDADSLRLREPVQVRGGSILSTREVRSRLPAEASRALGRAAIAEALARLGLVLVESGRYEATLRLEAQGDGAVLEVKEGPGARWDTLVVAREEAAAGPELLGPARGERFDPRSLERLLDDWVAESTERGYPFASARIESVRVAAGEVRCAVGLDEGSFCRVAEADFPGLRATRPAFLHRWLRFRPDRPYRESHWQDARRRLERTGLFVSTGEPEVERLEEGRVRVRLPVEEGKHNRIEGALGYSGRAGSLSGFADVALGNLFGTGRLLAVRWDRLRRDQARLRLEWREPLLGPLPVGSRLTVDQEDRDSTLSRLVLEGRVETALGRDLSAYAGGEYHRSLLGAEPSERVRRVSSLLGLRWETVRAGHGRGRLLDAAVRTGRSHVRPPEGGPVRRVRLERGTVLAEESRPLRGSLGLRLRGTAEAIGRNDVLPLSDVLRFGGIATLRGHEEDAFTARRYLALQGEAGPVFEGGRAYLFADGAWWRTFPIPGRNRDALAFGAGVRAESAERRLTVDLGVPRGGSLGEGRLHIRLESRF